jgi:hypothetical protein
LVALILVIVLPIVLTKKHDGPDPTDTPDPTHTPAPPTDPPFPPIPEESYNPYLVDPALIVDDQVSFSG